MKRSLLVATVALAAVGCVISTTPSEGRYVLSGLKEYADAPTRRLTAKDCRAIYNGEIRLASTEAFARYLARHRGGVIPPARRTFVTRNSGIEPHRHMFGWSGGGCGR